MTKNQRLAIAAILTVFLLSGCSWGKKTVQQSAVLDQMAKSLQTVDSLSFDLNVLAVNEDQTTTVSIDLTGQGQVARDDKPAQMQSDFSYQTTQAGKNFSLTGRLLSIDEKTYFKFNTLPKTGLLAYFKLTTDWYQLPSDQEAGDLVSSTAVINQSSLEPWFAGQQFLVVEEDLGKDFIDNTKVEKLRVTIDIERFIAATKAVAKNNDDSLSSAELKNIDKILQKLNKAGGFELWLGADDHLPRQIKIINWPLENPSGVTATITLNLSNFNQDLNIVPPADFTIFDPQALLGLTPSTP